MDVESQILNARNDFITNPDNIVFGGGNETGQLVVKTARTFQVDSDGAIGDELARFPIDTTITTEVEEESNYWEQYSFSDFKVALQSVSPLGTASGAVQVAHIPDPENTTLSDDGAANLAKIVRQSGSIILRPRDTKELEVDVNDTLFTQLTSEKRFSSFGAILVVLRDVPAVGDSVEFTITITATVNFFRPTILSAPPEVTEIAMLELKDYNPQFFRFKLPQHFYATNMKLQFVTPLRFKFLVSDKYGNKYHRYHFIKRLKVKRSSNPAYCIADVTKEFPKTDALELLSDSLLQVKLTYNHEAVSTC